MSDNDNAVMPPEQIEARARLAALIKARNTEDWVGWSALGKFESIEEAHALLLEALHLSADLVLGIFGPTGETDAFLTQFRGDPA